MKKEWFVNKIKMVLLMIVVIVFSHCNIAKAQAIKTIKDFDAFIDTAMKRWDVPGLAIGIIKDGNVIYSKGFGYKDLKTKEPVTANTLFSIASSTKSFTATLAAMIVDEKIMSFDVPLITYFPDFRMYDQAATNKITLRDLLTHRTGIPRQKFFSLIASGNRKDVRSSMRYFEPSMDFRYYFQYCNETFTVAGDMVAEKAGMTWEDLIRKRILGPLNMNSTILSISDLKDKTDYAKPYIVWDTAPEEMDYHNADLLGPAGSIISNVEDLSKWVLFNLNRGKVGDKQLINPQRLLQIQSPQIVIPGLTRSLETSFQSYGMGWFIDYYRGRLHIHHAGGLYGFTSMISFMPNDNIGIVILANLNGTPFTEILEKYVMDYLLKAEPIDWQKRNIDIEEAQRKQMLNVAKSEDDSEKAQKPPLPLSEYAGTYESNGYGSLNVRNENDSLKVKLLKYDCSLIYKGGDAFELYHPVEHSGWKTVFNKDDNGKMSSLSIQVNQNTKPVIYIKKN